MNEVATESSHAQCERCRIVSANNKSVIKNKKHRPYTPPHTHPPSSDKNDKTRVVLTIILIIVCSVLFVVCCLLCVCCLSFVVCGVWSFVVCWLF